MTAACPSASCSRCAVSRVTRRCPWPTPSACHSTSVLACSSGPPLPAARYAAPHRGAWLPPVVKSSLPPATEPEISSVRRSCRHTHAGGSPQTSAFPLAAPAPIAPTVLRESLPPCLVATSSWLAAGIPPTVTTYPQAHD